MKGIDQDIPQRTQWHRDLLARMNEPYAERPSVLCAETISRLTDYLGFRHFYRHSYSFLVDWQELQTLAIPLPGIWQRIKEELALFSNRFEPENAEYIEAIQ